jgi:hypothetical protein
VEYRFQFVEGRRSLAEEVDVLRIDPKDLRYRLASGPVVQHLIHDDLHVHGCTHAVPPSMNRNVRFRSAFVASTISARLRHRIDSEIVSVNGGVSVIERVHDGRASWPKLAEHRMQPCSCYQRLEYRSSVNARTVLSPPHVYLGCRLRFCAGSVASPRAVLVVIWQCVEASVIRQGGGGGFESTGIVVVVVVDEGLR